MSNNICNFQPGALVRYNPPDAFRRADDQKFGIVISVSDIARPAGFSYWVKWTNGLKTREWDCYLREDATPSQGRTPQCEGETDGNL